MAFVTLEDMVGTTEVIVFPKAYEGNAPRLNQDGKVFIEGRVSVEDERDAKLIADKVLTFDEVPKTVWIRFADKDSYDAASADLNELIKASDGNDEVAIFLSATKQIKKLGRAFAIKADKVMMESLEKRFGKENVQIR